MTTSGPIRVERRVGQRFSYLLPLSLREIGTSTEGLGFTQDLSSRGVFFFTDAPLQMGAQIELTLRMPAEITLGENMPVRCRGRILRVVRPASPAQENSATGQAETKIGVAVRLEGYEYLAEADATSTNHVRVATLHPRPEEDQPTAFSARPVLG
jgi:PilZ domain